MRVKLKAYYLVIGLFFLSWIVVRGQDQKLADSLLLIYQKDVYKGKAKLRLLKDLSFHYSANRNRSLKFANELIENSQENNNDTFLSIGYLRKGAAHVLLGNSDRALEALINSAEIAQKASYSEGEGAAYIAIADLYASIANYGNASVYYNKAIAISRLEYDSINLASALLNAGDAYFYTKKLDSALIYNSESASIFKNLDYLAGTAYAQGNMGMIYAEQGKDSLAEANINGAVAILQDLQDYYPISVYLTYMSDIYLRKGDFQTALRYAEKSLDLAQSYGLKEQISDANLKLSKLHQEKGDVAISYKYYKDHIAYRDSVKNIEAVQQIADQRTEFEVGQKQAEVDLLNEQKRTQRIIAIAIAIALALIGVLAIGLYRRNTFIKKTNEIIAAEKDRSENLLLNILPEKTAQELKEEGKVKAQKFESVSVLFTDFKGFTKFSENLPPEELVERVDFYFSKFDAIMEEHGLEKIKTIGDAYMCAAGLPFPIEDHASRMTKAALEIVRFVKESKEDPDNKQAHFDIRVGIHSGPVVAGVVGTKKFSYDIWGDTVNVASRMESNSEPGKINISESTYELIKDEFNCSFRGEIEAKNRGSLKMYFVEERK
jgi:class 3 adenylate cyclase